MKKYNLDPLGITGKYAPIAETIVKNLHEIPVTCFSRWNIKDPETFGEHAERCIAIANTLFRNVSGLAYMLKISDWAKTNINIRNRPMNSLCPPNKRLSKNQLKNLERQAVIDICSNLGHFGPAVLFFWDEYQNRATPRSKIAYQIKKFQIIRKSIEYQDDGESINAQDFIDLYGKDVTIPKLQKILLQAQNEL